MDYNAPQAEKMRRLCDALLAIDESDKEKATEEAVKLVEETQRNVRASSRLGTELKFLHRIVGNGWIHDAADKIAKRLPDEGK